MITHKQLRRARLLRDYSIKEMADKLNIDESTYSRLERGEIKISTQRLSEILVILNMNYEFLLRIETILCDIGYVNEINIENKIQPN
ncbi:MAG: helix-turn-helix domain-containing protein [Bacteroidia bacterium]|jgi:transcriptional regulator with XRE-family HTH domain|nr:helix-turn-helix domain-containing protein [Bacteroidia bacterium]